jgi:hypothetical protein
LFASFYLLNSVGKDITFSKSKKNIFSFTGLFSAKPRQHDYPINVSKPELISYLFLILMTKILNSNEQFLLSKCRLTPRGFAQAGVSQKFGRAINFQSPTKLSAGIHPRLRETAR